MASIHDDAPHNNNRIPAHQLMRERDTPEGRERIARELARLWSHPAFRGSAP
jgi:hypothetical protein